MARYCPFCVSRIEAGNTCTFCDYAQGYRAKRHHLKPGTILNNKYLVGRVLGEGGFGITYLGRDLTLDMKVAIKEYFPRAMASRDNMQSSTVSLVDWSFSKEFKSGKEQFIVEAQTIAKMDKESAVVTVRDFFEQNGSAYIVMEFIEGEDLHCMVERTKQPIPARELLDLLKPVFKALGELHAIGLIHRDISPDNIMIENGRARLIDFGCARESFGESGNTVLKHCFSPIEQYNNRDMGPWTDVYAMAATIYYCITGKLPPRATERTDRDELKKPSALGAKLRPKQERALLKALSVKREDRYQSMEEFGKDLFINYDRNKAIAIAACVLAVAGVAYAVFKPEPEAIVETVVETVVEVQQAETYNQITPVLTEEDELSATERGMLDQLSAFMGSGLTLTFERGNYYQLRATNKMDCDFSNIFFTSRFYNKDGAVVSNNNTSGGSWLRGESFVRQVYTSGAKPTRGELCATFKGEGDYDIRTAFYPVNLSDDSAEFSIKLAGDLPRRMTGKYASDPFDITFTEFRTVINSSIGGNYSVQGYFSGTYNSGRAAYISIPYRLVAEDGTIYNAGSSLYFHGYKAGDRFANLQAYFNELPAGKYTLELLDPD
ncbi:MAG: serine/threonine protein kinase [Oscillospiraceae bacterium]|nr:serine/threonine protein kinase [Oscillospiraceae bacterium]